MSFISEAFHKILYQPLFNILILFYQYLAGHDFGIAIILLTLLIRLVLYPLGEKAIKSQKIFQDLQVKIKEVQSRYKEDKEKQVKAVMELYQEAKINPFSSLLPLLVQLPILFALYKLFWKGFNPEEMVNLYKFIPQPTAINPTFLGVIKLSQPLVLFAVLAGIFQFVQTKMMTVANGRESKTDKFSALLQKQTLYFLPFFTVIILLRLPSAISLYWITTTIFSIIQQYFILRSMSQKQADISGKL